MKRLFLYLRRNSIDSEVDEELSLHLEMRAEELRSRGLSPEEARQEALRQFGDWQRTRAYCRRQDEEKEAQMQRSLLFQDLSQDLRIAVRSLLRAPVLMLTIVLTVGLGIGATAAIWSAIDAALLRPLPYDAPENLVRVYTDAPPFKWRFSAADYLAFRDQQTQFESTATFTDRTVTHGDATAGGRAEVLRARVVSWGFFSVLGVRPAIGRDFIESDAGPGTPPAVIASQAFWEKRLGGKVEAIGKTIQLDGSTHTLVGVLPAPAGPLERRPDLFMVQQFNPPTRRGPFLYTVIARLRAGTTAAVATSELHAINRRIFPIWKASYQDDRATWNLESLKIAVVGDVRAVAGLALASVVLVWLIACVNASTLLIARVTGRRQEMAVRSALGASRARLLRYLLAESAVLAVGAVALGMGVAWAGVRILQSAGAAYFPRTQEMSLTAPVWGLVAILAAVSGLIFGLIPAAQGTGSSTASPVRTSARSTTGGLETRRLRRILVGAQFAIATPLLIGACLLLASLDRLQTVDIGFDTRHVVTGGVRLPSAQYKEPSTVLAFWDQLVGRVAALPGVEGVALADGLPPAGVGNINNFDLEDSPAGPGQSQPATAWVATSPEYFRVLGLELLEGRLLDERDAQTEQLEAVVVDRAWARRFFPDSSAVGKRFREGGCTDCPWTTVVGVVDTVKYLGLDAHDEGTVYSPFADDELARFLVVRTHPEPSSLLPALERVVRELEPAAPLSNVATIDELVERSLGQPRSLSWLVLSFASVALLLSVVGIYGVMGYYVQQHLREISIRVALGGSSTDVLRLVMSHGFQVVGIGVLAGVLIALGLTRWMSSLLFGIGAAHLPTFLLVSTALVAVALGACFLPARRAIGIEPATVLRNE